MPSAEQTDARTARRTASPASTPRLIGGVLVAIVASIVVNAVIALIAHALGAHDDFMPLTIGAYGTFTVIGVVAGALGWLVVRRWSKRPASVLRWLVPVIVLVSLIPDLFLFADDSRAGVSTLGILALMVMHVATAAVTVPILRRVAPVADAPTAG